MTMKSRLRNFNRIFEIKNRNDEMKINGGFELFQHLNHFGYEISIVLTYTVIRQTTLKFMKNLLKTPNGNFDLNDDLE